MLIFFFVHNMVDFAHRDMYDPKTEKMQIFFLITVISSHRSKCYTSIESCPLNHWDFKDLK